MSTTREAFLRRFATSPIHVPGLERLLDSYDGTTDDAFASRFIGWDRSCADPDAARIVLEVLAVVVGPDGRVRRLSDDAVRGAIRWMADARALAPSHRAAVLRTMLTSPDDDALARATDVLETAAAADDAELDALARACLGVDDVDP